MPGRHIGQKIWPVVTGLFKSFLGIHTEGVFCPDVIFAAEQRQQARISYYGYDCRKKGTKHLTNQDATKPVGLTVDKKTQQVFWSNDQKIILMVPPPRGSASLCLMELLHRIS